MQQKVLKQEMQNAVNWCKFSLSITYISCSTLLTNVFTKSTSSICSGPTSLPRLLLKNTVPGKSDGPLR